MLNITKVPIPSDLIDVTPMVFMVLVISLLFIFSFLIHETSRNKKWEKIGTIIMYTLVLVEIVMNLLLVKISIDAGIEWAKNQEVTTAEIYNKEVQQ